MSLGVVGVRGGRAGTSIASAAMTAAVVGMRPPAASRLRPTTTRHRRLGGRVRRSPVPPGTPDRAPVAGAVSAPERVGVAARGSADTRLPGRAAPADTVAIHGASRGLQPPGWPQATAVSATVKTPSQPLCRQGSYATHEGEAAVALPPVPGDRSGENATLRLPIKPARRHPASVAAALNRRVGDREADRKIQGQLRCIRVGSTAEKAGGSDANRDENCRTQQRPVSRRSCGSSSRSIATETSSSPQRRPAKPVGDPRLPSTTTGLGKRRPRSSPVGRRRCGLWHRGPTMSLRPWGEAHRLPPVAGPTMAESEPLPESGRC